MKVLYQYTVFTLPTLRGQCLGWDACDVHEQSVVLVCKLCVELLMVEAMGGRMWEDV